MTDYTSLNSTERMEFIRRSLNRRHASEKRLRFYGVAAICFALGFLVVLLTTVVTNGYTALQQTEVAVELAIPVEELLDENGDIDMKKSADFNWNGLVKKAFRGYFPEVKGMMDKRMLGDLISANAGFELREELEKIGRIDTPDRLYWIKASDDVDMLMKGRMDRTLSLIHI